MGIINILDKHTANLIAAGEVVERPASAVKEMLENCADAGASSVTVEIKDGGTSFIRITDDGCGISREDVPKTILRHATSKIKTGSDLEAIGTLGFRGEALAAISAVANVKILTKRPQDEMGTLFICNFGEPVCTEDAGCPDGTTIIVEDIFENTPARRKFLKKNSSEAVAVYAVCEKFALSRPGIALKLISDGAVKIQTPGDGKLANAIYATMGKAFATAMLPVEYEFEGTKVWGYIGKPENCRPNRNMQNFFVNGRYVKSRTMLAAVEEGFRGFCPTGKYPTCVLFLEMSLSCVDVNIHPAKLEIKFNDDRRVFDCVYFATRKALSNDFAKSFVMGAESELCEKTSGNNQRESLCLNFSRKDENTKEYIKDACTTSSFYVDKKESYEDKALPTPKISRLHTAQQDKQDEGMSIDQVIHKQEEKTDALPFGFAEDTEEKEILSLEKQDIQSTQEHDQNRQEEDKVIKQEVLTQEEIFSVKELVKPVYVGEVFDTYIVVEYNKCMYLIDKHAAHERIIYERIKHSAELNDAQMLLEPVDVTLTAQEYEAVKKYPEKFNQIGFDFEEFGNDSFLLRSKPSPVALSDTAELFIYIAGKLAQGNTKGISDAFDRGLFSAACKAAIKAGNKFTEHDNKMIIKEIFENDAVLYCPHGRPVIVEFTKERIEKMFGRL